MAEGVALRRGSSAGAAGGVEVAGEVGGRSVSVELGGARFGRSALVPGTADRYLVAVRRDDSWAGSMATTQPSEMSPATMPKAVRDIAKPCKRMEGRSFRARQVSAGKA